MQATKWIELATSKDLTRFNLNGIYRDKNHLVATDGHRLHYMNGLPDAEPHYVDPSILGQFPDYKQVFPREGQATGALIFRSLSRDIKLAKDFHIMLKRLVTIHKPLGDKGLCSVLELKAGQKPILTITTDKTSPSILTSKIELPASYTGEDLKVGLNLKYLADLFAGVQDTAILCMEFNGELGPVHCKIESPEGNLGAIIMPMRLA